MAELKTRLNLDIGDCKNNCMMRSDRVVENNKKAMEEMKQEIINLQKKAEEEIRMEFKNEMIQLRKDLLGKKVKGIIGKEHSQCGCISKEEKHSVGKESDDERGSKDELMYSDAGVKGTIQNRNTRKLSKLDFEIGTLQ